MSYECSCIKCGCKATYEDHCRNHSCPKCGGAMRRANRPGPGQASRNLSEERKKELRKIGGIQSNKKQK